MTRVTHLRVNHRGDDGGEFNADDVPFTPAGSISSTNVQAAIEEVAGAPTRTVHDLLLNKSGGTVNAGDVVILDSANDQAFTTTTTAAIETGIGVVEDASIANNAYGYVVTYGLALVVNTNGVSVTRGRYLLTSTGAKQATGSATRVPGSFGQVLSTGANPDAWIWGQGDPSGGTVSEITDIPTAETDATLVLAPDGAGGVEFRAETSSSIEVKEVDGAPDVTPVTIIRFSNGSVTDDGGGQVTVNTSAGSLTDHTHAATGSGSNGGGATLTPGTFNMAQATPASVDGQMGWDTTIKDLYAWDTQRARGIGSLGWQHICFPPNFVASAAFTTALNLAANGGSLAIPFYLAGHMLVETIDWRSTDTSGLRSAESMLYYQHLNNGNSGENTLDAVTGSDGADSHTASAASTRNMIPSGRPLYLAPGAYWFVLRNTHATNTLGVGTTAASSAFNPAAFQTKTLGSALGSTLDFVAATWTKQTAMVAVAIRGRVFGETSAF